MDKLEDEAAWSEIGPTAAIVVALVAGVAGEAARQSTDTWDEASGVIAQATALRQRAARLAREDREAHGIASDALDAALGGEEGPGGHEPLAPALARAAEFPLEIAEVAADAAALAALVAEEGNADRRADAAGAVQIAAGAVGAAAHLVEVNLSMAEDDERLVRVREVRRAAEAAVERSHAASA